MGTPCSKTASQHVRSVLVVAREAWRHDRGHGHIDAATAPCTGPTRRGGPCTRSRHMLCSPSPSRAGALRAHEGTSNRIRKESIALCASRTCSS